MSTDEVRYMFGPQTFKLVDGQNPETSVKTSDGQYIMCNLGLEPL